MSQYALVDWQMVRSTPLKHTYRCGWRQWLAGGPKHGSASRCWWRQLTIEWDGKDQLLVRTGILWRRTRRWKRTQIRSVNFGLRELPPNHLSAGSPTQWLWYIQLNGKPDDMLRTGTLAEFQLAHQHEAPSTSRARVPARVQELLHWLERCTRRRPHGPILETDEALRQRILSHVD